MSDPVTTEQPTPEPVTSAMQWREAAIALREHAVKFDLIADQMATPPLGHGGWAVCGVVSLSGPHGEPLGCGYSYGHDGPHAWASLPTPNEPAR